MSGTIVNESLVDELKGKIRVKSSEAEKEISDLVLACKRELELAGVYGDESDPLYRQAINLYCKANYGYDEGTERFQAAYDSLKDAMALSGDYGKRTMDDGTTDLEHQK